MPNYYTQVTADRALHCTEAAFARLSTLLRESDEAEDGPHGFSAEYDGSSCYFYAEEVGSWGALSEEFLRALGEIIAANGLPYLEFGAGFTASRLCAGSCGGTYFRVMANGALVEPSLVWPEVSGEPESPNASS